MARTILMLSTTDWDAPQFGSRQQVARQLVRRGHRVLFAEPPRALHSLVSDPAGTRRAIPRLNAIRRVADGPLVFTPPPVLPLYYHPWTHPFSQRLLSRYLRGALSRVGWCPQVVWTYWPHTTDVIRRLGAPRAVYHCIDDFTGSDYPLTKRGTIARLERAQCRAVDLIFARSPLVADDKRTLNAHTHLIEGGVDLDEFNPDRVCANAAVGAVPGPRIGFLGTLDDRVDIELLEYAIGRMSRARFIFVGPVKRHRVDVRPLRRFDNVRFFPACPVRDAAGIIAAFDVAIIPYRLTRSTAAVTPLKLYEYLAMGKPVVATDLPYCRRERTVVQTAATPGDFVDALAQALATPPNEDDCRRRHAAAACQSWERHVDAMEHHLAALEAQPA